MGITAGWRKAVAVGGKSDDGQWWCAVFSKDLTWLEKHLWLSLAYYHFVLPHDSLSQQLSEPQPTRGSGSPKQWQPVTPAMAAGLTDHMWTMEELLSYRVPPGFRDRLDQQAINHTS